jgi:molecular chaperone Hsp33
VTDSFGPFPGAPRRARADEPSKDPIDPLTERDDMLAAFQIEGEAVRGRITRLGPVIDEILGAHEYPDSVANLLGEAVLIAALVGHSLKFEGKLIIQASGEGPVRLLAADYATDGGLRGFAHFDADRVRELELDVRKPGPSHLLGDAALAMTIDRGPDSDRYQSLVSLDGATLADAAESYFERSEQVPTRLKLAVAQVKEADGPFHWRAGGALLQQIAADDTRGETQEAWDRSTALFETLEPEELVDPGLSLARLLYRLFHEDGVRVFPPTALERRCGCSRERISRVLASFPSTDVAAMAEGDGGVRVTCEYCNQRFRFTLADIEAARGRG